VGSLLLVRRMAALDFACPGQRAVYPQGAANLGALSANFSGGALAAWQRKVRYRVVARNMTNSRPGQAVKPRLATTFGRLGFGLVTVQRSERPVPQPLTVDPTRNTPVVVEHNPTPFTNYREAL
jgi:hypothetical protein